MIISLIPHTYIDSTRMIVKALTVFNTRRVEDKDRVVVDSIHSYLGLVVKLKHTVGSGHSSLFQ